MTAVAERPDGPHQLRVHPAEGGGYTVTLDGHEVRPAEWRIEFDPAARYALAVMRLPVEVENLEALAVLDIELASSNGDPLEEC